MLAQATAGLQNSAHDREAETIERRTSDALTRCMTVLPDEGRAAGADDLYTVVSDSGKAYLVDAHKGTCECLDHEYRGAYCIHQRRVAFATGARAIPAWVNPADIDAHLGMHVTGTPRVVATDGGRALSHEVAEQVTDDEIAAREEREQVTDRPDDCACWDVGARLPCWPCFRDGFGSNRDSRECDHPSHSLWCRHQGLPGFLYQSNSH